MLSVALRIAGVAAVVLAIALIFRGPLQPTARDGAASVADVAAPDGATPQTVDDFGNSAPHQLIRYDIPAPTVTPALEAGASDLTWQDLYQDGEFKLEANDDDRVGKPTMAEFPAGTTAEDVMMFFLDIGDMRDMQARFGAIRPELDGKRVRIAGYTTPVGFAEHETRFLLVPELGACIHVPPPPPNQIVYVDQPVSDELMFQPVWVTGTLRAEPVATILADVGYQFDDVVVEPYR